MRKAFAFLLCLALCLGITTCALAEGVTYPVSGVTEPLRWWIAMNGNLTTPLQTYNEHPVYQELMKKTGVPITFEHPATGQEKEEFGLMLVDDLPDIIQNFDKYYSGGVLAGYDDGIVMDLTELVKEYAPDYYRLISADEETWREFTTDGKILAFYTYWDEINPSADCITLRQDWLDEFGLKAEDMTTYDAIEAYFQGIVDHYPDVAPFHLNVKSECYYMGYNVYPGWMQIDGKVCYYDQGEQAQYRAWLEKMHEWYEKKYISVDFASYEAKNARAMFSAGTIGCFTAPIGNVYADAEVSGLSIAKSPFWRQSEDTKIHTYFPGGLTRQGGECTVITTNCKDPVAAVKLFNYNYTDEGMLLSNYGVEGLSYTVGEDGAIHYTDLVLHNPEYATSVTCQLYRIHYLANRKLADTTCNPNITKDELVTSQRKRYTELSDSMNGDYQMPPGMSLTVDENSERSTIMNNVNTYIQEMRLKFITGTVEINDQSWAEYLQKLSDYGLTRAVEITQNAYDRYLEQ